MENRFDLLAKLLAGAGSRREMLKQLAGVLAGGWLVGVTASCERDPVGERVGTASFDITAPGRCKKGGQNCRENPECCSNFCDPLTAKCVCRPGDFTCPTTGICVQCPPDRVFFVNTCTCGCRPGEFECPTTGRCVACPTGQVLDPTTCQCVCPSGMSLCGSICCPTGSCCAGVCCRAEEICVGNNCRAPCPPNFTPCGATLCCAQGITECVNGQCLPVCPTLTSRCTGPLCCPELTDCCPSHIGGPFCCPPTTHCSSCGGGESICCPPFTGCTRTPFGPVCL